MCQSAGPFLDPVDLGKLRTYPLGSRENLVHLCDFARLTEPGESAADFLDSLPNILAAKDLRRLARHIAEAHRRGALVALAMGAHVIKCGLSPVVTDLIDRGIVGLVAMNGAGAIHDYEVARLGATSEDVARSLPEGRFGLADETARAHRQASELAQAKAIGLGQAFGQLIEEEGLPHRKASILATAWRRKVPATVHVALGTDIVHMHPAFAAGPVAEASHRDFRILCAAMARLAGGVWLNVGSAVMLPEVFLKAVNVAHNLGHNLEGMVAANLDMIPQYRAQTNVVGRPVTEGITLLGRHEFLLPLVRLAVLVELARARPSRCKTPKASEASRVPASPMRARSRKGSPGGAKTREAGGGG